MHIKVPESLVCIFAHPDDEAFGPGGAIAHYAKICPVDLICVTDGDGGGDAALGEMRKKELAASCKILGVRNVIFLGFHDGGLNNNNYHAVAGDIQKNLDRIRPDTVMTFDIGGVSGHLDHIAVAMVTSYLFERLDYLKTLMYYGEGSYIKDVIDDYFVYVPPGFSKNDCDLVLDVSAELEMKIRAMRQHVSQKEDCDWILDKFHDHLHQELFKIWTKTV